MEQEEEETEPIRPEDDLPTNMCSTMLIPRLNALIAGGAFDAYSSTQIPRLIDMAEHLEAYLGTENIRFSVCGRYSTAYPFMTNQIHFFSPSSAL
jgi:GC-rich sequence DNA-binding factor